MSQFLKCEFFTLLKLVGLLITVNIIVKIIGAESYSKVILLASVIAIVIYIFLFIWKFIRVLVTNDSEYQCKQGDTFKRALTWLSNIV
ncbi:olfactory receptor Olr853 [Sulfuricurvum kujiense DSM 16994]|uniref:Olfactory receptor Olr853 n=1 Tax=Sulfuricurvum kujiense (strain ATCC BAA-921 / DSM 16994 / JCM 11577 / YK-1) TaxID=709032 RepID=E4TX23_SULKY|nr:hypothetical protein [Sulfuricurvum kujiense]ADR33864.1 olfactory receptor Olr853 [Sulfuricurvum kujiense DSM 16994]